MSEVIEILFDGPPSHESGRFVEVEDGHGHSIDYGEWVEDGDYWKLVYPDPRELQAKLEEKDAEISARDSANSRMLEELGQRSERIKELSGYLNWLLDKIDTELYDEFKQVQNLP